MAPKREQDVPDRDRLTAQDVLSSLGTMPAQTRSPLTRFDWLSIATATVTISLKATAYMVGLMGHR